MASIRTIDFDFESLDKRNFVAFALVDKDKAFSSNTKALQCYIIGSPNCNGSFARAISYFHLIL